MEDERFEGITRVVLNFLEAICLQSSMLGKRWPCPKKGTTQISFDISVILVDLIGLTWFSGLWRIYREKEIELKRRILKEEGRDF